MKVTIDRSQDDAGWEFTELLEGVPQELSINLVRRAVAPPLRRWRWPLRARTYTGNTSVCFTGIPAEKNV